MARKTMTAQERASASVARIPMVWLGGKTTYGVRAHIFGSAASAAVIRRPFRYEQEPVSSEVSSTKPGARSASKTDGPAGAAGTWDGGAPAVGVSPWPRSSVPAVAATAVATAMAAIAAKRPLRRLR